MEIQTGRFIRQVQKLQQAAHLTFQVADHFFVIDRQDRVENALLPAANDAFMGTIMGAEFPKIMGISMAAHEALLKYG